MLWVVPIEIFWIHRFFSYRKILIIRIFDLILDFSKETHLKRPTTGNYE